ncbi:hypothetical protein, partial [Escherichia coli]|uniref:hypothetical protein n=1 Tax=Escherichia coli TaxID=562 RepID=UPI00157481FE
ICRASQASCAVMRGDIDQPITARDHRSMTTARYQMFPGAPTIANVHPDEVDNWKAMGWKTQE